MLASGIHLAGAPVAVRRPQGLASAAPARRGAQLAVHATSETRQAEPATPADAAPRVERAGLGELGPIGMTVGKSSESKKKAKEGGAQAIQRAADAAGFSLGPIGLTIGSDLRADSSTDEDDGAAAPPLKSMASMTTEEWRSTYEQDGRVDLWMQDEFNAASRLVGGRSAHYGIAPGIGSGEGPSVSDAPRHKVKIKNHFAAQEIEVEVPEDRFILFEAEEQGLVLPWACRLGCCTACAVKVKSGEMYQPYSLGVSKELRERGYALMCVGFPLTDLELETVPEDEVYDLQFGNFFAEQALDPNGPNIEVANAFEAGEYDE
jgi:ferredoxin